MINLNPYKLWSTTVYKDFGTSQDQCYACQKECIFHAHTGGVNVIIAILDPSTVADEEYFDHYDWMTVIDSNSDSYNATQIVNNFTYMEVCWTGLIVVRPGESEVSSNNFGARLHI
jgi:hypothetical protein